MTTSDGKNFAAALAAHSLFQRRRADGANLFLPQRYEPGTTIPSPKQMRRQRLVLCRQKLLVDTLAWVYENEQWLRSTYLELDLDEAGCWFDPLGFTERCPGTPAAPDERAIKRLVGMLNRLGPRKKLDEMAGGILGRMNRAGWAPEHAVKILGGLGFRVGRWDGPLWITEHFPAEVILALTTPPATVAPKARRL